MIWSMIPNPVKDRHTLQKYGRRAQALTQKGGLGAPHQKSNYELFNCSNFNIRYWSWNYRGCWPFLFPTRLDKQNLACLPQDISFLRYVR